MNTKCPDCDGKGYCFADARVRPCPRCRPEEAGAAPEPEPMLRAQNEYRDWAQEAAGPAKGTALYPEVEALRQRIATLERENARLRTIIRDYLDMNRRIISVGGDTEPLPDDLIATFARTQAGITLRMEQALKGMV